MLDRMTRKSIGTTPQQKAQGMFKPIAITPTGDQLEKQAFAENRERLKRLRLARDAELESK